MNKRKLIFLVLLLATCYSTALIWAGLNFVSFTKSNVELTVAETAHQQVTLGTPVELELTGSGFTADTQASVYMDINNKNALLRTFPMEDVAYDMLRDGDNLYVSKNRGMQRFNVSDPLNPQMLFTYLPHTPVMDINLVGDYFYLSCGTQGVRIYKKGPEGKKISFVKILHAPSAVLNSYFADGYLYVAAGNSGVLIYNVSDPRNGYLVDTISTNARVLNMAVHDSYFYLTGRSSSIQIYKLVKPEQLESIGEIETLTKANKVVIHAGDLYSIEADGVMIYSLSDPAQPKFRSKLSGLGSPSDIFFHDQSAYIADGRSGVHSLEVTQPGQMKLDGFYNLDGSPRAMLRIDDFLYVALSKHGLRILDPDKIMPRQMVESINTPGTAQDIKILDQWMYIADTTGLYLVDISLEKPRKERLNSHACKALTVVGDMLLVSKGPKGVEAFNIKNPGSPQLIFNWPDLMTVKPVVILNSLMVIAKGASGLSVVDMSDMKNPVEKFSLNDLHVSAVKTSQGLIFVGTEKQGVKIYRLSSTGSLNHLRDIQVSYPMSHFFSALDLLIKNNLLYIANGKGGVIIVDIQNPEQPEILSTLPLPGGTIGLEIVNSQLFTTSLYHGLQIVDVSSPKHPKIQNEIDIYNFTSRMQIVDDRLYLANGYMGVTAIPIPTRPKAFDLISEGRLRLRFPSPNYPGRYSVQLINENKEVTLGGVLDFRESDQNL